MPATIWDCHDSFWQNRRFVTWQLLRRNEFYQKEVQRCIKRSQSLFVPTRSYPPTHVGERFEFWQNAIELFAEVLLQPGTIREFKERLSEPPIQTCPPQPDQFAFRCWADSKELNRTFPYRDLFLGQLMTSDKPLPTARMKALGLSLSHIPEPADSRCVLMTIHQNGVVVKISTPFHGSSDGNMVFPLVDPKVDFPPPMFLPIFNQSPPDITNRKAYGTYLYDKTFQPFQMRRGRPKTIKESLRVWELNLDGKKDSEIARTHFNLQGPYPGEGIKPKELQMVHDLKVAALKAIAAVFPDSTKKN